MNIVAQELSEQEIKDVSYYLAAQDICSIETKINYEVDGWVKKFREGQALAHAKNCSHCHGSFHHAAPRLYGQKKSYMKAALDAFKNDKRPGFFKMINIAKTLTPEESEKLIHYYYGMRLLRDCQGF